MIKCQRNILRIYILCFLLGLNPNRYLMLSSGVKAFGLPVILDEVSIIELRVEKFDFFLCMDNWVP